ncbi:MAG: PilZ domain-containing protein [Thermaerobacter sp.]|nr:PilZ domain-containing protein [Thermaerobacter sp.]
MPGLEANQPVHLIVRQRAVATRVIRCVRQEIYLDALRDNEMELTPLPNSRVPVRWILDDVLYQQVGLVLDVLDPIPILVMKLEGVAEVLEHRGALRVKVQVPVEYGMLRPGSDMLVTTTLDLSSLGLKFPSAMRVWQGLELRMTLRVETDTFSVVGRVVRVASQPRDFRGRKSWETAVQFIRISSQDRQQIERYVKRQHQRMKLGM